MNARIRRLIAKAIAKAPASPPHHVRKRKYNYDELDLRCLQMLRREGFRR